MEGYTEIFVWGKDNCGQLGLGTITRDKVYPSPVFCSFNIIIKDISCGEDHSGFISDSGHVYCMGSNSNGKLGTGDFQQLYSSSPCLVESLSNLEASKISCGWTHTAVITSEGHLFTWGSGEYGALGTSSFDDEWAPKQVFAKVSEVSCGSRHMGIISDKQVYLCGAGEMGQLGTNKRQNESQLTQIASDPAVQISCGIFHTGFVTEKGAVYMMGGNSFGQLGIGTKKTSMRPEQVNIKNAIKVYCGNSSACITTNGLFVWGTTILGEFLVPKKLKFSEYPVTEFAIGGCFAVAIDSKSNVFSWGSNSNGELATGSFESKHQPEVVGFLKGKKITKIAAGGNFAICLGMNYRKRKGNSAVRTRKNQDLLYIPAKELSELDTNRELRKSGVSSRPFLSKDKDVYSNRSQELESQRIPCFTAKNESSKMFTFFDQAPLGKSEQKAEIAVPNDNNLTVCKDNRLNQEYIEAVVAKIKENSYLEIQGLKEQLNAQVKMQKELEKDLELAISHTTDLEEALREAHAQILDLKPSESKILELEDENRRISALLENSEIQLKAFKQLADDTSVEINFYLERNQDLQQQIDKQNNYIKDLQGTVEKLSNFVREQDYSISILTKSNATLQDQVLGLQFSNNQILNNFEKDVNQKAKEFKDKTINILSGQKSLTHRNNTPEKNAVGENLMIDRGVDELDVHSARKLLSDRQQEKVKNAANMIVESKENESPLKNLRISSPSRQSPERPCSFKFNPKSTTPSKEDVKSKINSLMNNRSRIEKKLQMLQKDI